MGAVDEDAVDGSVAGIVVAVAAAATVVAAAATVVAGIVVGAATAVVDDTVVAVAAEAAVVCTVVVDVDPRYCTVDIPDLHLRIRISAVPAFVSFYPKKSLECLHL